jgi:hypothetical protein
MQEKKCAYCGKPVEQGKKLKTNCSSFAVRSWHAKAVITVLYVVLRSTRWPTKNNVKAAQGGLYAR